MINVQIPPAVQYIEVIPICIWEGLIGLFCKEVTEQPAWKAGLVFGYNLADKLDPSCNELHEQTIARCKVAARAFRDSEVHDLFITCRLENAGMKMAHLMKACLVENGVPSERIHVIDTGFTTSTVTEIQIFQMVLRHVKLPEGCKVQTRVYSSWYHIKRIGMVFDHFAMKLDGWSNTGMNGCLDLFTEILKIAYFWAIPGVGERFGKIELPRWVTDSAVEEANSSAAA